MLVGNSEKELIGNRSNYGQMLFVFNSKGEIEHLNDIAAAKCNINIYEVSKPLIQEIFPALNSFFPVIDSISTEELIQWIDRFNADPIKVCEVLVFNDESLENQRMDGFMMLNMDGNQPKFILIGKTSSPALAIEQKIEAYYTALTEIKQSNILSSGDMEVVMSVLTEILTVTLEFDRASFWFWNRNKDKIIRSDLYNKSSNEHSQKIELSKDQFPNFIRALAGGEFLMIPDAQNDVRSKELTDGFLKPLDIQSLLIVPIYINEVVLGFIFHANVGYQRIWEKHEILFALQIADCVSVAVQNIELQKKEEMIFDLEEKLRKAEAQGAISSPKVSKEEETNRNHTEKMASLGTLIAGVAHEINTPLGAINAAGSNVTKSFPVVLQKLPAFFKNLSPGLETLFNRMVEQSLSVSSSLSSREERAQRKKLKSILDEHQIPNSGSMSKELVKIGLFENIEEFLPILSLPNTEELIDMAYSIGRIRVNIDNIGTAVQKTQKIVFALKSYSRKSNFEEPESSNIIQTIETVLTIYHNQLKYGVEVVTDFEENIPNMICFPDELIQVWTNIIHNAIQAMDNKGKLMIKVVKNEDQIYVIITDTGPGIPDDIRDKIFRPFFTTKPEGEGSGLGLDICSKIIKKHGGTIEVESVPGLTSFIVKLPIILDRVKFLELDNSNGDDEMNKF